MFSFAKVLLTCLALSHHDTPKVAIIIDDIGYQYRLGQEAISLPGAYALAIMPFTPHTQTLAVDAVNANKEVILHLPMEARSRNHLLGEGALLLSMSNEEISRRINHAINAVPHVIGVNNHMGSLLTTDRQRMKWVMSTLAERNGIFFIDSRTTAGSVIKSAARSAGVQVAERHVFLDNEPIRHYVREQLAQLVAQAHKTGYGLAIGHPYPATLAVLKAWEPSLDGVELVSLSTYVASLNQRELQRSAEVSD